VTWSNNRWAVFEAVASEGEGSAAQTGDGFIHSVTDVRQAGKCYRAGIMLGGVVVGPAGQAAHEKEVQGAGRPNLCEVRRGGRWIFKKGNMIGGDETGG